MQIVSHSKKLKTRLVSAFQGTAIAYDNKMQEVIHEPRYWPGFGTTHRRNGTTVGVIRNIVDLQNLADSQQMAVVGSFAQYKWDGQGVTPVVLVHEGYTLRSGRRVPPRRWTEVAAQELDLGHEYVMRFRGAR